MLKKIGKLRSIVRWQKAVKLMSHDRFTAATEILASIDLEDGQSQIALVQLANCLLATGKRNEARLTYSRALESERNSQVTRKGGDSAYIVDYCLFFIASIDADNFRPAKDDIKLYDTLISHNVSSRLKGYLPPPSRSALRK